jgi:hypothetical protein
MDTACSSMSLLLPSARRSPPSLLLLLLLGMRACGLPGPDLRGWLATASGMKADTPMPGCVCGVNRGGGGGGGRAGAGGKRCVGREGMRRQQGEKPGSHGQVCGQQVKKSSQTNVQGSKVQTAVVHQGAAQASQRMRD